MHDRGTSLTFEGIAEIVELELGYRPITFERLIAAIVIDGLLTPRWIHEISAVVALAVTTKGKDHA